MMYYYGNSFGNSWGMPHMYGFGFGFLGVIFWVFVIYVFVRMLKHSGDFHGKKHHSDPVAILKERYAKGEINKEQFEAMKKDLE